MRCLAGAAVALALLAVPSCVTPEPCTRAYFAYQADALQNQFVRRNRGEVRRLRTLQSDLDSGGLDLFTALAIASAKQDVERLVADVRTSVIPDARAIASRCGIDEAFDIVMNGFLAEQGIDPQLVRTLGLLDLFEDPALATTLEPAN